VSRVALVTGASAGIGLAVCRRLRAEGARVAMVARTRSTLDAAASSVGGEAFPLDVSDLDALAALPGEVVARLGRLDIVVNSAGVNHRGPTRDFPPDKLAQVITTNLTAPVVLCRAAVDHLGDGGAIVNVASLAGMIPVHHEAAYSASKAGLRAFTRVLAEELPGVKVGVVCPGPVDTGFFGDVKSVPDLVFSQPMSTADEVADAVMRCIRDGGEIALPRISGALCTIGYLAPSLMRRLRPALERRGARSKRRYMDRKGMT
jgi:NAD(P)-dependent dehydrogenase (short-subunit alcohol dehydrogenase family)